MAKAVISITTKEKVEPTAKRSLQAEYDIFLEGRKMKRCLLDNLDVVEVDRSKEVKLLPMPLIKANGFTFELPIPSDPKARKKIVEDFMGNHPFAYDFSGKYSKPEDRPIATCIFTVSDELLTVLNNTDKEKVKAFQTFSSLNLDEKRAIAIYFGEKAYELDEEEIDRTMISLDKGIITTIEENRKIFNERLETMFDKKEINIKIAQAYNALTTDGSVYMVRGRILGSTFSEIVQAVTNQEDLYNLIIQEMMEKGIAVYGGRNAKEKAAAVKETVQKASVKA